MKWGRKISEMKFSDQLKTAESLHIFQLKFLIKIVCNNETCFSVKEFVTLNFILFFFFSLQGDRLGRLWSHREESIYGCGTDNARRFKLSKYRHRLVQTLWNNIAGQLSH